MTNEEKWVAYFSAAMQGLLAHHGRPLTDDEYRTVISTCTKLARDSMSRDKGVNELGFD